MVAAKLATLKDGQRKSPSQKYEGESAGSNGKDGKNSNVTRTEAAKAMGVSTASVDNAKLAGTGDGWKRLFCGGLTKNPPPYPTPPAFVPERFEALTDDERKRVPHLLQK